MELSGLGLRVHRAPYPGAQSWRTRSGSKLGTAFAQIFGCSICASHKTPVLPLSQLLPAFGAGGSTGWHWGTNTWGWEMGDTFLRRTGKYPD